MKTNYQLLDCGNQKKLELFDNIRVIRNAFGADWEKDDNIDWDNFDLKYQNNNWFGNFIDKTFNIYFDDIYFELKTGNNGQLGIFPEQISNWQWLRKINKDKSFKIINGFAYTGASTLFASNEYNEICHLDSSKPAINRAKKNAELSNRSHHKIRWITEDVISFLEKEVKRGHHYQGFIFDPPAFGRGGKNKIWKLKKDLPKLLKLIDELSKGKPEFVLISAHDVEMPLYKLHKMFLTLKGIKKEEVEKGNLIISAKSGNHLPSGYFVRWYKK